MTEFRRFEYTDGQCAPLTPQMVDIYCHAFRLIPYVAAYCVASPSLASGAVLKDISREDGNVEPQNMSISAGAIYMSALEHIDDSDYHEAIRRIADLDAKGSDGSVPMPFEKPRDVILRVLDRTIVEEVKLWHDLQLIESKMMVEDNPSLTLDEDIRVHVTMTWPNVPYWNGRLPRTYLVPQMWRVANGYFHGLECITREQLDQITSTLSAYTH